MFWLFRPCEQVESLTQEIVDALIRSIRIYRADQIEIQWKYLDDYKKCLDLFERSNGQEGGVILSDKPLVEVS